jgi:hypothetical protein
MEIRLLIKVLIKEIVTSTANLDSADLKAATYKGLIREDKQ